MRLTKKDCKEIRKILTTIFWVALPFTILFALLWKFNVQVFFDPILFWASLGITGISLIGMIVFRIMEFKKKHG